MSKQRPELEDEYSDKAAERAQAREKRVIRVKPVRATKRDLERLLKKYRKR